MGKEYISAEDIKYHLSNLKQLTFEVTDACNLNCKYCAYGEFYNDYDHRKNKKISLPAALKLIDYLVELWNSAQNVSANRNVYVGFYGGEPLLNMPFIKSIVDYIDNLHCPHRTFIYTMTTNALLLGRYMDYLANHDFNLLISLDGDEYNTSYRVNKSNESAYPLIIKNVDALKEKYPGYFMEKVNFNAVLHNRNSINEIYEFFKTRYNKIPSIGELNNMGIRPDKEDLFQRTYRNSRESLRQSENYEAIEQDMFMKSGTYQSATTFLHRYSGHVYHDYTELLFGQKEKTIPTGTCIPFGKKMFVTVNSKILPCEKIGQQYALGSVSKTSVELDFQAIADKYNAYYAKLERQCSKCRRYNSCLQCIFNLNNLNETPVCYGFMDEKRFHAYQAGQIDFLRKHPEEYYRIMEKVTVE
ncbi:radical SAM peptide maturase [Bacteroidia bacterium]|nr:radical SAM peptide maturase [Bacteroidia bacterium]GHT70501.1 radical SAM peptide maturase [Bacteroidia bacterium]GHU87320.1 radical SAM peptide maturase [Bacteroidia bacterium]